MIRPGFLDSKSRQDLIELTRDGSAAHRLARRANALLLLDDGMSCEVVAKVLYPGRRHDPDLAPTVSRGWDRGPGEFRLRRKCLPTDGGAAGEPG